MQNEDDYHFRQTVHLLRDILSIKRKAENSNLAATPFLMGTSKYDSTAEQGLYPEPLK